MKRCPKCGEVWTRPSDHNCGRVTVSKDRLRTLEEAERELASLLPAGLQPLDLRGEA